MSEPRVAIVHDYLTQRGGAERVVLAMAAAFPDAAVHTSLYDPDGTFPEFRHLDVRPAWVDRLRPLRRHHVAAFPALAPTFSRLRPEADVVLCSTSGWAHGVGGDAPRLLYVHTPARWLHRPVLGAGSPPPSPAERVGVAALGGPLRRWDRRAARSAARVLVNSSVVAARVARTWDVEADVVPPPVVVSRDGPRRPVAGVAPGFVLCVSRLQRYKRVDAVVRAFADPDGPRLVVVGEGPDEARVRALAGPAVRVLGCVDDAELRWLYASSAALVSAAEEDFGLTPVEAAAFGRPALVPGWGGFVDTVVDGVTGVHLRAVDPGAIARGVRDVLARDWDHDEIADHAARFGPAAFASRLRREVAGCLVRRAGAHEPAGGPAGS